MTKAELIDEVAERTGASKKETTWIIDAMFGAIAAKLKKHEKVQISGFGTFEPRRRKARVGRNPRTQEEIKVAASWSLGFGRASSCEASSAGRARDRHNPQIREMAQMWSRLWSAPEADLRPGGDWLY